MGGSYGVTTPNISGVSNAANTLEVDGLLHNDMGTPAVFSGPISMDAIGEVKMLLNNYQAEYTGNGSRIIVTGKAQLPHGERTFTRWFDPTVFARPAKGDPGNAPRDVFRLPGVNNWDISLFKNVPVMKENRYFQFRFEMYNAFNHTQYSGVNTSASFDPQGNQVNALFGTVTSARAARVMQMSLKFAF